MTNFSTVPIPPIPPVPPTPPALRDGVTARPYGRLAEGLEVSEYTLRCGALELRAINWGGIVTSLQVPDRHGRAGEVVLGLPTLEDYVLRNPHFGTIVGRYANRIAGGRFRLDGALHQLATNDGAHALHGGPGGFGAQWWAASVPPPAADGSVALEFSRTSPHGEEGYPGALQVTVRYTLTPAGAWRIDYRADTDRATILNLTHHDYFNLACQGSALDQVLTLHASHYTPVDAGLIPTGIAPVAGTPFDFRTPVPIARRLRQGHAQLVLARGYDHNWVLDRAGPGLVPAGTLHDPVSGRSMDVLTTEPGLQFYSGNFLDGSLVGAAGATIRQGDGVCLETQHFPDTPNQPGFPGTTLQPGQVFRSATEYRFRWQG